MWIQQIEIEAFGKFKNYSLPLKNGFQVIYGGNENGKTTLMDFIKLMLYGKPNSVKPLRKKYAPFSGERMSGSLDIVSGGSEYLLQKTFGATAAKDRLNVINVSTGEDEPPSAAVDPGVKFLGLALEGFEQVCFVSDTGRIAAPSSYEAEEQTIANLTGTGDEHVSRQLILRRLTEAKEALISKSGRKGLLVEARETLQTLQDEKAHTVYIYEKQASLAAEYERLRQQADERRRVKKLADALGAQAEAQKLERLVSLIERRDQCRSELVRRNLDVERLPGYITRLKHEYEEYYTSKKMYDQWQTDDQPLEISDEEITRAEQLARQLESAAAAAQKPHISSDVSALRTFAAVIISAVAVVLAIHFSPYYLALLILTPLTFLSIVHDDSALTALRSQADALLERHGCASMAELRQKYIGGKARANIVETRGQLRNKLELSTAHLLAVACLYNPTDTPEQAAELLKHLEEQYSSYESQCRVVHATAMAMNLPEDDSHALTERLAALGEAAATAEAESGAESQDIDPEEVLRHWYALKDQDPTSQMLELQKRMQTPERTPDQIEREIRAVREQAAGMALRYKALTVAIDVMLECVEEMRHGFGDILNKRTGVILSQLTNGAYERTLVARDYGVKLKDGAQYRESESYSSGTVDQTYLALRLALAEMIASGSEEFSETPPLFLDDSLMQYDDDRAESSLEYIMRREGQTVLFTCHNAIADMVTELGGIVTKL